jgi:hypothetical protein
VPTSPPPAPASSFSTLATHCPDDDDDDVSCCSNNGEAEVSHLHDHVRATVHYIGGWWHELAMSTVKTGSFSYFFFFGTPSRALLLRRTRLAHHVPELQVEVAHDHGC